MTATQESRETEWRVDTAKTLRRSMDAPMATEVGRLAGDIDRTANNGCAVWIARTGRHDSLGSSEAGAV